MRKALVIGIDYYTNMSPLHGCASDALAVKNVLDRNGDGSRNFDVKLILGSDRRAVAREDIKDSIKDLFSGDSEIALLYFAGHGHIEAVGGYLCTSDNNRGDDGLALAEVLTLANESRARNKVLLLDTCYSGAAGTRSSTGSAELNEGLIILTASTAEQYASEENGAGVFTTLLVDALGGAATNLLGDITPGSVYAHIDRSLGPWQQRPVFKANVKSFVSLRRVQPPIALSELRRIADFFPYQGYEYLLDPSFEPESENPSEENTRVFAILQKYNRVNLLVPVDAPHMWHAAMQGKSCKLTALGEHYRRLVSKGRI